jgi:hypothetical protein
VATAQRDPLLAGTLLIVAAVCVLFVRTAPENPSA